MNYLKDYLPRDILYELCLYLKYHEIYTMFSIDKDFFPLLESRHLWQWKFKHEFNLDISGLDKSLLPLHMKYIELRSVSNVDWDSDLFIGAEEALLRAYRFKDRDLI